MGVEITKKATQRGEVVIYKILKLMEALILRIMKNLSQERALLQVTN